MCECVGACVRCVCGCVHESKGDGESEEEREGSVCLPKCEREKRVGEWACFCECVCVCVCVCKRGRKQSRVSPANHALRLYGMANRLKREGGGNPSFIWTPYRVKHSTKNVNKCDA